MEVKVRLFSYFREIVHSEVVELELDDGATIQKVIKRLTALYGQEFEREVFSKEKKLKVAVVLNNKAAGLDHKLKDHDVVSILPVAGGG
jgi:MoaD family protein